MIVFAENSIYRNALYTTLSLCKILIDSIFELYYAIRDFKVTKCEWKMESKLYIVRGDPIAWSSWKLGYSGKMYNAQKHVRNVYQISVSAQHEGPMFSGPLKLEVTYVFPMPKSRSKIHHKMIGQPHIFAPDTTNLTKFLEDALVGIILKDDRIIAWQDAKKIYGEEPRTEFRLIPL